MQIRLLYGDNIQEIDDLIQGFKKKFESSATFNPPHAYINIERAFLSRGMFDQSKLIVIINLLAKHVYRGRFSDFVLSVSKLLNKGEFGGIQIIMVDFEEKRAKYYKKLFPNIVSKACTTPKHIFLFLDSFVPGKKKQSFSYFQSSLSTSAPQLLFYMLKRRLRELISAQSGSLPSTYQPWQRHKIIFQSQKWDSNKLMLVYKSMHRAESAQRGGETPYKTEQIIGQIISYFL